MSGFLARQAPWRTDFAAAAAAFVAAAILGNVVEEFTTFEWSLWAIQAILALSLTLVWGYGGIFSFGQAAIYGIGAYAYGFFAINYADTTGETITAVGVAVLAGCCFAALLGYFMFYGNVADVYVAIITLATSLVIFAFVNSTSGSQYRIGDAPFGGYNGMTRIPRLTWRLPGGTSHELTRSQFFLVVVGAALLIAVGIRVLSRRPFGRIAVALQQNELRTKLVGYDVRRHKLAVFVIGGAVAAFGGALFAAWGRFISPPVFSLTPAALVVIWVLVGGRKSVSGALVGVLVVEGFSSWFGGASGDNEPIVLGVILILIVLVLPGGIVPTGVDAWQRFRSARIGSGSDGMPMEAVGETVAVAKAVHLSNIGEIKSAAPSKRSSRQIATTSLSKSFGGLVAVNNVTLEFPDVGVSCVIGPNGAGKSTFFGLLSGRLDATAGSITIGSDDVTRWHPFRRARLGVGIKLQVASIYGELSTRENLWLACYAQRRDEAAADMRVEELLAWLQLESQSELLAGTLSHGQQQWLEIGMVVATDPTVILLDEPTAGMTRHETERTAELVRELSERASVIVVEHDMRFVRELDAPIILFHMGEVFAEGRFEELSTDERVVDIYLGRGSFDAAPQ